MSPEKTSPDVPVVPAPPSSEALFRHHVVSQVQAKVLTGQPLGAAV